MQAVEGETRKSSTTIDTWPPAMEQKLADLRLPRGSAVGDLSIVESVAWQLATLADDATGSHGQDHSRHLGESSRLLREAAERVNDTNVRSLMLLQAAALVDSSKRREAACGTAALDDPQFVLWCGPLATWYTKSRDLFHSFLLCERSADWCSFIGDVDSERPAVIDRLRDLLLQPDLSIEDMPAFLVGDLLVCGGEANLAPKHFSYFLPEDFGVKRTRTKKTTLVFANVYLARYWHISARAAHLMLPGSDLPERQDDALRLLLLWFRGHDVAHSLRTKTTDYAKLRAVGSAGSAVLQEALVDVVGLLMALDASYQERFELEPNQIASVFLAEMLGYLRRDARWFPDSAAAVLALAFLASREAVSFNPRGSLVWDFASLRSSAVELARYLVRAVLGSDVDWARDALDRYVHQPPPDVTEFVGAVQERLRTLPTSFAYQDWHAPDAAR